MKHYWWRSHLRQLPELGTLGQFGQFQEADELMPFLTTTLGITMGSRILDLGCGRGSFSVRLAQWGCEVVAVDQSQPMLDVAAEAALRRGVTVEFRCSTLGSLPDRSAFDGAMILDFGAYDDAENAEILRTVASALRPGASVIFTFHNPYYWCREPTTEHQFLQGVDVVRRRRFDFSAGCVVSRIRCIGPTGERRDLPPARFRAYTLPELRALTAAVGLADLRVFGEDREGRPQVEQGVDNLSTPYFHCVALRPVHGEAGEGI